MLGLGLSNLRGAPIEGLCLRVIGLEMRAADAESTLMHCDLGDGEHSSDLCSRCRLGTLEERKLLEGRRSDFSVF